MPPTRTVFGPEQVLARIDQKDEISEEISLLGQEGSEVIYGDVVTLPVADALVYAVPLFLRANESPIPELEKVLLVQGDDIVMRDTLSDALAEPFGVVAGGEDGGEDGGPPVEVDQRVESL